MAGGALIERGTVIDNELVKAAADLCSESTPTLCRADLHSVTEGSGRGWVGVALMSISALTACLSYGLRNGIQKVVFVPQPGSDLSLISPCIRSTS